MVDIIKDQDYSVLMNDMKTVISGKGVSFDGKNITLTVNSFPVAINTSYVAFVAPSIVFSLALNYVHPEEEK